MKSPEEIIQGMYNKDLFSQWLGIEILETAAGSSRLKMIVRPEMCNGFGLAHGGITYSIADTALAFASNSHGRYSLSIETSISHMLPVYEGDELVVSAEEKSITYKIAIYDIKVLNQKEQLVALFRGTVYRKDQEW